MRGKAILVPIGPLEIRRSDHLYLSRAFAQDIQATIGWLSRPDIHMLHRAKPDSYYLIYASEIYYEFV